MKAVFEAITAKASGSSLSTDLTGDSFFLNEAPSGTAAPYGVYQLISDVPTFTFDTTGEEILIQFSLYAEQHQVLDLFEDLKTLFDNCKLNITGYRLVTMEREFSRLISDPDTSLKHYMAQYRLLIEKE